MLTISDSIAIKILNDTTLIAGVGNEIRVFTNSDVITLPFNLKGKVHGIEFLESSNKILIYGEQEFILVEQSGNSFQLLYRGFLSDWISSGKILNDPDCFMLVTAHSVAILFKYDEVSKTCEIQEKTSCTDKSTLYCSYIYGSTWEHSVIIGGNAFGEILLWQQSVRCDEDSAKAKLVYRVPGHNGVIFSIDVDKQSKLMVTTSDDRSIRFWDIVTDENGDGLVDYKRSFRETIIPRKSGYSHVARVFKGKIIHEDGETYAITGGEDSYICLWNMSGELMFKRRQQFGATIWSLDYHSRTKTLFTTGSSGNLLSYCLKDCFKHNTVGCVLPCNLFEPSEYIAKIKFLNEDNFVGITSKNRFMYRSGCIDGNWTAVENFVPYKCTVLEAYINFVVVAGHQIVTLFEFDNDSSRLNQIYHGVVLPGVIRSFIFLSENEFLICDETGNCKLIRSCNFENALSIDLPLCKERWITTACKVDESHLALSNRQGSLMVYSVSETNSKLCDTLKRLHGHLGATTITLIKEFDSFCIIKSSGHDGSIKTVKFDKKQEIITVLSREMIPISWVERIFLLHHNNNEILFGFNDNHFVCWSREVDKHFEIPCGGGHRCWDLNLQLEKNQVSIVFIKNKQVFLHQESIFNRPSMPINVSRNKWHVKPCNVLSYFKGGSNIFLVSAGDDNLMKISLFNPISRKLTQLHESYSHISSIRGLRVWNADMGNHFIFSCGGRAQICVTEFNEKSQLPVELIDYSIQKEKPSQDIRFDPETRVMSIDVRQMAANTFELFAGCSDGFVRKFIMLNKSEMSLLSEVFYGRCILHVRVAGEYLLTVATDGVVCLWNLDISEVIFKVVHHESGVNSFDVRLVDGNEMHLLTGGDDQQVVYSKAMKGSDNTFEVVMMHRMDYLHSAQVTAVRFSPCMDHFYSSSVDQVVHRIDLKTFKSSWAVSTCVADVKGIDVITNEQNIFGFVYGCGLQVLGL